MPHVDVRDLGRVRHITAVLARHGFGSLLLAAGLTSDDGGDEAAASGTWAARIRQVLVELGPTFVKLGQVLSVRPDIVPAELMEELATLQDSVPPAPWEEARALLEAELHAPLGEVFQDFDPAPVASASIAQVHLAVLADGREVAVKVQRPGIRDTLRSDLHILYTLAHLAEGRIEVPGVYTPVAIVREFERSLADELEFLEEARNAARFRAQLAGDPRIVVPEVFEARSTSRVLVMERIDGEPISRLGPESEGVGELMDLLIESTFAAVFDHGFFHGDPHPGNLFRTPDGRLAYLDFGLCGTLTPDMRDVLVSAFTALVFQDAESLALTIYRAGGTHGRVDLRAFRGEIERLMHKYHGASLSELGQASLTEFIQVASSYQIRLRPEFAVLARTASLVDGVARRLIPDADMVARVRPYAQKLMAARLSPDRLAADALRAVVQAQGGFRELPTQLNQLLLDLERGRLSVVARDPEAARLREEVRNAVTRLVLAIGATGTLLSGALLFSAWAPTPLDVPVAGLMGLAALALSAATWATLVTHLLLGEHVQPRDLQRRLLALVRFFVGDRDRD
jgi:ubiquinone biosynthesis protein